MLLVVFWLFLCLPSYQPGHTTPIPISHLHHTSLPCFWLLTSDEPAALAESYPVPWDMRSLFDFLLFSAIPGTWGSPPSLLLHLDEVGKNGPIERACATFTGR